MTAESSVRRGQRKPSLKKFGIKGFPFFTLKVTLKAGCGSMQAKTDQEFEARLECILSWNPG